MNDDAQTTSAYQIPVEQAAYSEVDAPLDDADGDDTAAIRGEIEQTRADLSQTVNAIHDRLSPQNLIEQAKDTVRDATIGKAEQMVSDVGETARGTGSSIVETVRQNPVPAALAAIGVGWLWMNRSKGSANGQETYRTDYRFTPRSYDTSGRSYGAAGSPYQTARMGDSTRDSGDQSAVRQGMQQVQDKAGQLVDGAQSGVSQLADQAQSGVGTLVAGTQQQAYRAQGQLQQMLQETPLAVGGIALALGAAVGLAIPETTPENQLMGETRDTLMQKAQETAQDTMQKVQGVAQKAGAAAIDTAKDEAHSKGLTGS